MMSNIIQQPWIYLFLLPAAILFSLICIVWAVKKLWKVSDPNNNDDIAL